MLCRYVKTSNLTLQTYLNFNIKKEIWLKLVDCASMEDFRIGFLSRGSGATTLRLGIFEGLF